MASTVQDKIQILVVDDNPAVLTLLGSLFREEGMEVTLAASAPEARQALAATKSTFDLVLSDISMPGETGFDLLSWIKRDDSPYKELPVLLTTAQLPEAENRVKGLAMGAVDYVVRPIELSELVIRAAHAVEHFRRVRGLEASLADSENLAMVGRLLAASHHEIKNIASLVSLASTQTIRSFGPIADGRGQEALRALEQSAALLVDVSKSVSTLLQPGTSRARGVNLAKVTTDVAELMRPRVKPIRIELKGAGTPVWATADELRVKQVLINMILNAGDAIEELESAGGGAIRIVVGAEGDLPTVRVVDDGIGFEPPGVRREFKAFSTTKTLRGGQGLGLWLCSTLMANMGGHLTLASTGVGEGAEATLTLPRGAAPDDLDVESYLVD